MTTYDSEDFVREILESRKYRNISEVTVRDVITYELARHGGSLKEIRRLVRKRLHRIWAAYLGRPDPGAEIYSLQKAFAAGHEGEVEEICRRLLSSHQSSRERIPILSDFYRLIFSCTGAPERIHDLACAYNPFSFRWMGLPRSVRYHAYDINLGTVRLINSYMDLENLEPLAEHRDILCRPPEERADVAFLFKMYHCLEHRRNGAGWEVVERAPADWIAVTFPTRNLASRTVDIYGNYGKEIQDRVDERAWLMKRLDFSTEIVLLIRKRS